MGRRIPFPDKRKLPQFISRFEKILIQSLFAILFVLVFAVFLSCGSKKKNLEVSREKEKTLSELDSSASLKLKIEASSKLQENTKLVERELEIDYEGCEGDSLTVTETGPDGKIKSQTTIKGKGKAKLKSKDKTTDTKKSEASAVKKDVESGVSVKKKDEKSKDTFKKELEVKKSGLSFWFWFWLVLIVILVLWLDKKFSIVKRVTAYISKLLNLRKKIENES